MKDAKFLRFLLLPFGLTLKLYELAIEGTRDIYNRLRFAKSKIDRKCCIDSQTVIDKNCHVLENCIILNSKVNSYSYIGKNSIVQNAKIGRFCSIANDVFIGLGRHPAEYFSTSPIFYRVSNTFKIELVNKNYEFEEYLSVEIGNDVWIGARAIILDGIKIGDGAIIAANAVVTKDVPPYAIVGGIPAKVIKHRFKPEKIAELLHLKWWDWSLLDIKKRIMELCRL